MTVILVHGLLGHPKNAWFPWLIGELESRGFDVKSLKMPNPAVPVRSEWVRTLREAIVDPTDTILVGHSLGCPTILNAVADFPDGSFPRIVLVAGFGRPFTKVLEPWFSAPLDFDVIRAKAKRWAVIHSTNDAVVPYAEGVWLSEQLKAGLVTKRNGHFRVHEGGRHLPEVLDAIVV
jgi:hypothetical protein